MQFIWRLSWAPWFVQIQPGPLVYGENVCERFGSIEIGHYASFGQVDVQVDVAICSNILVAWKCFKRLFQGSSFKFSGF